MKYFKILAFVSLAAIFNQSCASDTNTNKNTKQPKSFSVDKDGIFPVDKVKFNETSLDSLQKEIQETLNQFSNFEEFLEFMGNKKIFIEVSSDERETKTYLGGNVELSEKRAELLKQQFLTLIKTHFGLQSTVQEIEEKLFIHIAIPHGADFNGFTPHTRIINPATGKYFSDEEWNNLSVAEKDTVYDQERFVKISCVEQGNNKDLGFEKIAETMGGYEKNVLLIDASGSMSDNTAELISIIEKENSKLTHNNLNTTTIIAFDDNAYTQNAFDLKGRNPEDVVTSVQRQSGTNNEKVMLSLHTFIDGFENSGGKKTCINLFTDEGIQDANLQSMKQISSLAKSKQCIIYINLLDDQGGVYSYTLDEYIKLLEIQIHIVVDTYLSTKYSLSNELIKNEYLKARTYLLAKLENSIAGIQIRNGKITCSDLGIITAHSEGEEQGAYKSEYKIITDQRRQIIEHYHLKKEELHKACNATTAELYKKLELQLKELKTQESNNTYDLRESLRNEYRKNKQIQEDKLKNDLEYLSKQEQEALSTRRI